MFNRLRGLFLRYERAHRHIEMPGFDLPGGGRVERVCLRGDRLTLAGDAGAGAVLTGPGDGAWPDQELGPGFEVTRPIGDGRFALLAGGARHELQPVPPSLLRRQRLRLAFGLAGALLRAAPALPAALWRHDPAARARVKAALGLELVGLAPPLDPALFAAPEPGTGTGTAPAPDTPVTIVLPVYNAFDLLEEVLERVVRHTDLPWRLVVIEDCSSDARVRPWLRDWAAAQEQAQPGRIDLVLNETNQGFIGAVNAGLDRVRAAGTHAVLLNSDAFVPAGWASRLLAPIVADDGVASVTPMSNDAEIFSVPAICARLDLVPGQGDAIDVAAQALNAGVALAETPTGVGFCMAMNARFLNRIPQLDTVFGRGYGEEVDWCRKAAELGGRHVGTGALFVEHRGGESFGSAEKRRLVAANGAIISRRYPTYDTEVQDFIAADPLATARLALALAWAAGVAGDRAVPVYLAHSLGGGAEDYLVRRIRDDQGTHGLPAVVLRVGGPARWQVELVSPAGCVAGSTGDFALVERLLAPLRRRRIVYSCGVGDTDPVDLPDRLLALKRGADDTIEVLVHDWLVLSPSYTLLDADGVWRGARIDSSDPAHVARRPDGQLVPLADWRAAWGRLLAAADDIVVFSEDGRDRIEAAHPGLGPKIRVRPHALLDAVPRLPRPAGSRRVVGVLGNINMHKGAGVLAGLTRRAAKAGGPGLVLIGNLDPLLSPPAGLKIHGDYRRDEIPALAARYGITDWLIPSVWPETFSYTTHECLATGLPTYAFALGAQGAAVAAAENGRPVPLSPGGDPAQDMFDGLQRQAAEE